MSTSDTGTFRQKTHAKTKELGSVRGRDGGRGDPPGSANEFCRFVNTTLSLQVADPGFPVGGVWTCYGGRGPLMQVLFAKNVCENERIGSRRGGVRRVSLTLSPDTVIGELL